MVENSPSKQDLLGSNLGRAQFSFSSFFLIFVIVVLFLYCIMYICLFSIPYKPSFHFVLLLAVSPKCCARFCDSRVSSVIEVAALYRSVLQRIRELFSGTLVSLTAELSE